MERLQISRPFVTSCRLRVELVACSKGVLALVHRGDHAQYTFFCDITASDANKMSFCKRGGRKLSSYFMVLIMTNSAKTFTIGHQSRGELCFLFFLPVIGSFVNNPFYAIANDRRYRNLNNYQDRRQRVAFCNQIIRLHTAWTHNTYFNLRVATSSRAMNFKHRSVASVSNSVSPANIIWHLLADIQDKKPIPSQVFLHESSLHDVHSDYEVSAREYLPQIYIPIAYVFSFHV